MEPATVQPTMLLRMTECLARFHHSVHLSAERLETWLLMPPWVLQDSHCQQRTCIEKESTNSICSLPPNRCFLGTNFRAMSWHWISSREDTSSYAPASIEKYQSGVTNSAQEDTRFKGLEIWKDKNWYTKLRAAISKAIVVKCIEEGRPLYEMRRSVW